MCVGVDVVKAKWVKGYGESGVVFHFHKFYLLGIY